MALKGHSSADRTARWDLLVTNLTPEVPQMPHVADDLKTLGQTLAEARTLQTQQEDLRSQARAAAEQLKQKLRTGDKIRARLGSTLRGKLGFNDVTLAKYGFKPAPVVRRSKAKAKSKTPPAATGTPADTSPASQGAHPTVPTPTNK